jgi:hypothetical protein
MDIKKTNISFSYRIEEKPGGGFIAHTSDPTMETIEAATKQEIEQKIHARMNDLFGAGLPGFVRNKLFDGLSAMSTSSQFSYHIEEKTGGGFTAHFNDPKLESLQGASREEVAQKLRETFGELLGPQHPLIAEMVDRALTQKINETHHTNFHFSLGSASQTSQSNFSQSNFSQPDLPQPGLSQPGLLQSSSSMGPILPADRSGMSGIVWRVIIALLVGLLVYFLLHLRR